ncbi:MAG: AbgT family transporter [Spongiibacteraceae bacterium]|jgi:aminobenzoyl-glutamate transport protein|nr:AbgT family transporter [Spongiibacteraceae bacterium]
MPSNLLTSALTRIERAGNRLPHPTLLFVWLCLLMLAISWLAALSGLNATLPDGTSVTARSLLSQAGLHWMLTSTVSNFVQFAPVGTVLVAMLGIGITEHSGLLRSLLRLLVLSAPRSLLTFMVVITAMLSHTAADAGYVVLIPLAGILFATAGRPPLAGIFAAFAGVSGGYSANLVVGPIDAILAGLSTEAAHLVAADYVVNAAGNYYFSLVSAFVLSVVATLVSEKLVEPRLAASTEAPGDEPLTVAERRGLRAAGIWTLLFLALLVAGSWGSDSLLRDPQQPALVDSPLLSGVVTVIAFYAAIAGIVYGRFSGSYQRLDDAVTGMETHMATMAPYLVLMFFAAQFVSYFGWSQLGTIVAVRGAELLGALNPGLTGLMIGLVILTALINLLIGSASAKWAVLAPVFVPMFYLLGVSPEATQMAFRIGDSSTNIITPLMPYFGVVVAFAQRYDRQLGIGTLIANMLPFSIAFLLSWSLLFVIWIALGWPLGPGAPVGL